MGVNSSNGPACGLVLAFVALLSSHTHANSDQRDGAKASELFDEASALRHGTADQKPQPEASIKLLRTAAQLGHPPAMAKLGEMLLLGEDGSLPTVDDALPQLRQAADQGDPAAQMLLGILYSRGDIGKEPDEAAAVLYTHFSALAGHTRAELSLGYRHLYGIGVPQNCHDAVSYYTRVADKAVSYAQNGQAPFIEKKRLSDGPESNANVNLGENEDVLMYYQQAADSGDPTAQSTLGQLYYYGARGVARNFEQALHYFTQAAEQGDGVSMSNLGHMYAQGLGTTQDNATALHWFKKGALLGNAAAKNGLGYLHMYGIGVNQNYQTAITYFTQAAEAGNPEGQFNIGAMQIGGLGVKRDHTKAVQFFTLAAQQGHMVALYNLGLMHLNGLGTPRSCPVAVQILKGVAERGPWASMLANATNQLALGNVAQALAQFELMGEVGFEVAQSNAAFILDEHGDDLTQLESLARHKQAMRWYRRAAQQANVHAELRLGDYYYFGLTGDPDYAKAAAHYRTAAELKNPQAMFNMGFLHQFGQGLPRDLHLSKRYYDMAADTQSKAYVPASLALMALPVYSFYLDNLEQRVMEMESDDFVIAAIATLLAIVVGAILIQKMFASPAPTPAPSAAAAVAAPALAEEEANVVADEN